MDFLKKNRRLILWLCCLAVMIGATWWIIRGLENRFESMDVVTDETLLEPVVLTAVDNSDEGGSAFFVNYRLQRERTRDRSIEMLQDLLDNPNAGASAKEEAEKMLLEIVQMRERELLVENMVKAQGYDDAVFFYQDQLATVMVKHKDLDEKSFIQIAEAVAAAAGIDREDVQVMARP
jgi:stage III sporulation protein AH